MTVTGVGDFSFKEPGPAVDVAAPPGAGSRPGLRRGSVIWEGFSPGRKTLVARVTLDPATERPKLPVVVEVQRSGDTTDVRLVNQTGLPVDVADGEPDAAALDAAASRAIGVLTAGRAPLGGVDGIPAELPSALPVTRVSRTEPAPVRLHGTAAIGSGVPVAVDAVLPSATAADGVLRVHLTGAGDLHLDLMVTVVLPDASRLADATAAPRARLAALEDVIWQGLRSDAVAAYLGNPRPGVSTSTFHYVSAMSSSTSGSTSRPLRARPLAIAIASFAVFAVVLAGAFVWSRS